MKIPNMGIHNSLNNLFVDYLTNFKRTKLSRKEAVFTPLEGRNFNGFKEAPYALFAAIPYNNCVNNTISTYEEYYASVVFTFSASLGLFEKYLNENKNIHMVEINFSGSDKNRQ
jgi:hypothetical protein